MRNWRAALKKTRDAIVVSIQKILITVSLVLVYFLGFGLIFLFCLVFKRGALRGASRESGTFWVRADGFESGMDEAARQS